MVESTHTFYEHIRTFVAVLITTGDEHVQGLVQVQVKMPVSHQNVTILVLQRYVTARYRLPIKMSANEIVDFFFCNCVQILKFVEALCIFDA